MKEEDRIVVEIRLCKKCGFILGTRPGMKDVDGICLPCINSEKKKTIDYEKRQQWLSDYISNNCGKNSKYDAAVGVSGGKDSTAIVKRLVENHGLEKILLINVTDEFTHSQAGEYNLANLAETYNLDTITVRCQPKTFKERTKSDFIETLHPLKWIEQQIYEVPLSIAKDIGIGLIFYGENSDFEYGGCEELSIFHQNSDDKTKCIFLGAIYPYSNWDSYSVAKTVGFKDLTDFHEWYRQGSVDSFCQIDSIGYMVHHWCKFIKFGFQRVSDMACRFVREGKITREQAMELIKDRDYMLDPYAKYDFCRCIGISENEFDEIVDKFANTDILVKDANGMWRRKDLYKL